MGVTTPAPAPDGTRPCHRRTRSPPRASGFRVLASALDPRSAPRLAWLLVGAILARGRRTVTSWIRAAGLSGEYRPCYTTVAAAGKRADSIAARLAHGVVKPLVAGAARLTFALDDTPTERYGRHVQGAGVHHNPSPGPAGGPFVYGHVWVVLGLLAAHPAVGRDRPPAAGPAVRPARRTWRGSTRGTGRRSGPSWNWRWT